MAFPTSQSPITPVFYAAQGLSVRPDYLTTYPVTKEEYSEHGTGYCRRRFTPLNEFTPSGTDQLLSTQYDQTDSPLPQSTNITAKRTNESRGRSEMANKKRKGKKKGVWAPADSEEDALTDEGEYGMKV